MLKQVTKKLALNIFLVSSSSIIMQAAMCFILCILEILCMPKRAVLILS